MQQTTDQCFEQSYLSNLPIEGNTLDYGQFLELCITKQPSGLGLHFKMGEADKLFNNMDKNKTGKIRLDDWISHFACRQVQVNLCQKHIFLDQLTHNKTKDCSLIHQISA